MIYIKIDMRGRQCGQLYVIEKAGIYRRYDTLWRCLCACGKECVVPRQLFAEWTHKNMWKCNIYSREGLHIRCIVSSGRSFIFDECDLPIVRLNSWCVNMGGYVLSSCGKLHRVLMNSPKGCVADHIDGDPSNCCRENPRVTSQRKNTYNAKLSKNSTTGYKGVCFDKSKGRYLAFIHPGGKTKFLGYYDTPQEAAAAYDKAAVSLYGEYAWLNGI